MTVNKLTIDREVYIKMEEAASNGYPCESCAVLIGDSQKNTVNDFRLVSNIANEEVSKYFYRIGPLDVYRLEKECDEKDGQIIGFFHTHVFCESCLSGDDMDYMIPGMIYVVLSLTDVTTNRLRAYKKEEKNENIIEYEVVFN